jgi:hypothetical protein
MKTCPTCGASADVLIVNVATGTQFCHHCAARECPSFLPHFILTVEDAGFRRACGIDPEVARILDALDDFERVGGSDDVELVRRRRRK